MITNIAYYTTESFFQINTKATDGDFEAYLEQMQELEGSGGSLRRVVLDDSFLSWLRANKKRNGIVSQQMYMNSLTDEEVEEIWRKHGEHIGLLVAYVPIILLHPNAIPSSHVPLSSHFISDLQDVIRNVMNTERVWAYPYLVRSELLPDDFEERIMVEKLRRFVECGEDVPFETKFLPMMQEDQQFDVRFVPFVTYREEGAVVNETQKTPEEEAFVIDKKSMKRLEKKIKDEMLGGMVVDMCPYIANCPHCFKRSIVEELDGHLSAHSH
jgi:hypothetical protein